MIHLHRARIYTGVYLIKIFHLEHDYFMTDNKVNKFVTRAVIEQDPIVLKRYTVR